jgi:hypothetical protein
MGDLAIVWICLASMVVGVAWAIAYAEAHGGNKE